MNTQKKSLNPLKTCLLLIALAFFTTSITAQNIWQVDSRIEKMTITNSGGYYILDINVKANNDDDARSPKLIVALPRNCKVTGITLPQGYEDTAFQVMGNKNQAVRHSENAEQVDGYINFDLPNLSTRTDMDFKISFKEVEDGLRPDSQASAFIYSLTPEKDKKNNFPVVMIN